MIVFPEWDCDDREKQKKEKDRFKKSNFEIKDMIN